MDEPLTPILEAKDISKSFPDVVTLDDVDLTVLPGEVHRLVGQNGAGKSALVKVIMGAITPDAGELRVAAAVSGGAFDGLDDASRAMARRAHVIEPDRVLGDDYAAGYAGCLAATAALTDTLHGLAAQADQASTPMGGRVRERT